MARSLVQSRHEENTFEKFQGQLICHLLAKDRKFPQWNGQKERVGVGGF